MTNAFKATYTSIDGTTFEVRATRGTQAVGKFSGQPLDATEYGAVVLAVSGTVVFSQDSDLDAVLSLLSQADTIAHSRDVNNDQPRTDTN